MPDHKRDTIKIYSLLIVTMAAMSTGHAQISIIDKIIESEYPKPLIIGSFRPCMIADTTNYHTVDTIMNKEPIKVLVALMCSMMDTSHPHVQVVESYTIPGWGTKDTLCILDGVPLRYSQVRNMDLDSTKIKSKTWLNSEDATAVYGSRGINGTYIIVTQKKSKTKKPANR